MQRYSRYRRKTGLVNDGLDPALLTQSSSGGQSATGSVPLQLNIRCPDHLALFLGEFENVFA
jgi:hypothetical protein